jgi:ABC-type Zn2+ transport system substrate-binding protein/surface adhesin
MACWLYDALSPHAQKRPAKKGTVSFNKRNLLTDLRPFLTRQSHDDDDDNDDDDDDGDDDGGGAGGDDDDDDDDEEQHQHI